MPTYEITQESTGITIELEGDKPPGQEDITRAFSALGSATAPEVPQMQPPKTFLEKVKEVAPSFIRLGSPVVQLPTAKDISAVGRTLQAIAGREEKPPMLEGASMIEKEGPLALFSAGERGRERGAEIGRSITEAANRMLPSAIQVSPEVASRLGQIGGEIAADVLTPQSIATLGIGGAARQAARLPMSAGRAAVAFGEAVAPRTARTAQIADILRAGEAIGPMRVIEQGVPAAILPEVARGTVESIGSTMETLADPNASAADKVGTALQTGISTLFTLGLGAQARKIFNSKSTAGIQQVLDDALSKKRTVGAAIDDVEKVFREVKFGIRDLEQPSRIITPEKIDAGLEILRKEANQDQPFIFEPEKVGGGPREYVELGVRELKEEPGPSRALKTAEEMIAERVEPQLPEPMAEAAAAEPKPLRSIDDLLAEGMRRRAAQQLSERLESGEAVQEPAKVSRKSIERALGIGREPVGQQVAESLILREASDVALERAMGKYRTKAEEAAQGLEKLRAEVEPGAGANPIPQLLGTAWNGAINVAQGIIRSGGTVADAVAAALRFARENFKGRFNEEEFTRELTRTIETPSRVQPPEGMEARRFAERVAAAPGVPPVIREAVAASPEASYKRQSVPPVVEAASRMTDAQLDADIADAASNTRVASAMEKFNRQIAAGNMADAAATSLAMAKSGTTWGQLINQFKLLNASTKEGILSLVSQSLAERKRKPMTQKQASELGSAMDSFRKARDGVTAAERRLKEAADSNDPNRIKIASGLVDFADAIKNNADVSLNEKLARINPSTASDLFISLVQGSVMAPISIVRNVLGNAINIPIREAAEITASGIDAALFGGKNNSYEIKSRTVDRLNALSKSLPAAWKVMMKGSDAMPYEVGTDIGNPLNFTRAWRNLFDAMSGQYEGAPIARNLVEATIGVAPDILLRATQATDIPFRQMERARIISEIARQRGLTEAQAKVAIRNPELYRISDEAAARGAKGFTDNDLGAIEFEAARTVYQQDNLATQAVSGANRFIREKAGSAVYVPYRLISLFQKTPINVAAEALSFTPAGVLRNWSKLSPRERNIATGRLIVGSVVTGAFAYLYDKGVISANLDTPGETNKARELSKSGGVLPPGVLNVSGLRRLVRGGDPSFKPGDEVKDLSALGVMGALGIMVGSAKRIQERSRTGDPDFFALGKGAVLSGVNFIMEQQFLKGTSDFIKLLSQEGGNSLDRWVRSLAVTAASPLAPNTLGSIRRAERESIPAIGGEGFIKDAINEMNQRYAALGLQIPGTKDPNAMPTRRDLWGEAVRQTPKSENPWLYNLFDAWKSRDIEADPLNAEIYRTWRKTADNKAIPSLPNPKMTWGGVTYDRMTPEQYDRFSELVGKNRRILSEKIFMSPAFQNGNDERKITMLDAGYERGLKIGKYLFMRELQKKGQSLTPLTERRGFREPSPE